MPIGIIPLLKLAGVLLGIGLLFWAVRWLFTRGVERQALKETKEHLQAQEDARAKEKSIQEAARRVREAPGPAVPDADELQRRARREAEPPRT